MCELFMLRIPVINTSDAVDPRTTSTGNTVQNYNTGKFIQIT